MRGDTFTISILCRSHFWECANTQWLAEKTWVFVSLMFNERLAHRKFFTIMQAARTWVISVYMFSKLSILLFVLPFLTSRNVLYLSVPDLSTSLGKKRSISITQVALQAGLFTKGDWPELFCLLRLFFLVSCRLKVFAELFQFNRHVSVHLDLKTHGKKDNEIE